MNIIRDKMMFQFIIIFAIVCVCGAEPDTTTESSSACPTWCKSAEKRDDYIYSPGVGAHKVHTVPATGWNAARRICNEEGGHLAIVNSVAEAKVIGDLLKKENLTYAHIGFHDLYARDDYVTVHSDSLAKAGFTEWAAGQPSGTHGEDCGGLDDTGKLHDVFCDEHWVFVCELSAR